MRTVGRVLAVAVVCLVLAGAANYSGMCLSELRYLPEAEKANAAVSYVLGRGWLPHNDSSEYRYESAAQYMAVVPDCCEVAVSRRLFGSRSTIVIANVPRATAESASAQELSAIVGSLRDNQRYFIAVSSCGRAWDPFD